MKKIILILFAYGLLTIISCSKTKQDKANHAMSTTPETPTTLLELIKKSIFDAHGVVKKLHIQVKDDLGKNVSLFLYQGIAFRADARNYSQIKAAGGFESQNKLNIPENMQEAQGIGVTKGASGQSGVSTSKILANTIAYCVSGPLYVINTSKLDTEDQAYDFDEIVTHNYPILHHDNAREVNILKVPIKAIVGWFPLSFCNNNDILGKSDKDIEQYIKKCCSASKSIYSNEIVNNGSFVFNPDYKF